MEKFRKQDKKPVTKHDEALLFLAHRIIVTFQLAVTMTKTPGLQTSGILTAALKEGRKFVETFLKCMPRMCRLLEHHREKTIEVFKDLQTSTRQIQSLASHGKTSRQPTLAREAPAVKKALESLIYQVKNAVYSAAGLSSKSDGRIFQIGTLKNRNVDGTLFVAKQEEPEEEEEEEEEDEPPKKKKETSKKRKAPSNAAATSSNSTKKRNAAEEDADATEDEDENEEMDNEEEEEEEEEEEDQDGYGSLQASEEEEEEDEDEDDDE
jgi:hypothetical protein